MKMISDVYCNGLYPTRHMSKPKPKKGERQGRKGITLSKSKKELEERARLWKAAESFGGNLAKK